MGKAKHRFLLVTIISLIVLLVMGITGIYAWLTDNKDLSYDGVTSQFHLTYELWFDQGEGLDPIDASSFFIGDDEDENNLKVIQMSLGDKKAPNYIGKLRIKVNIETNGKYYLRIKFNNEWFMEKKSLTTDLIRYSTLNQSGDNIMPYNLADGWFFDALSNYIYYTQEISTSSAIDVISLPMTTALEYKDYLSTSYETKYYAYLDVKFEYVQANRMYAIWNLDRIPQAL